MRGLIEAAGFDVFTSSLLRCDDLANGHSDRKMSCRLACEGIVRTEGARIRVTFRLCGADGLHLASWRFDAERKSGELLSELELMASEIVAGTDQHEMVQVWA